MTVLQSLALFTEGLLSFFSPCVLPILPIYVGILAGNTDDNWQSRQKKVIVNTLFFVLGISLTFFLLTFATSYLSHYFLQHSRFLQGLSALMILIFGLFQLGLVKIPAFFKEISAKHKVYQSGQKMTPFLALIMGFAFSFSWTPCIGPILASVFLYASSQTGWISSALVATYCLGFILPFVLLAFFSQKMLVLFKVSQKCLRYTKLLSGVLLVGIALSLFWNLV